MKKNSIIIIIIIIVVIIFGCATPNKETRVDQVLVRDGQEYKEPQPIKEERDISSKVDDVKKISYFGKSESSTWQRIKMSHTAIEIAIIKSSIFKQKDIDKVVEHVVNLIGSEYTYIHGSYTKSGGRFFINFLEEEGKEITFHIGRRYNYGKGSVAKIINKLFSNDIIHEEYVFNLDGVLLDIIEKEIHGKGAINRFKF